MTNRLSLELIEFIKKLTDNHKIFFKNTAPSKVDDPFITALTVKVSNQKIHSWGVDFNQSLANLKAIMELLERLSLNKNISEIYKKIVFFSPKKKLKTLIEEFPSSSNWIPETSSGFAVHTKLELAKLGALSELIERHVILKSLAEGIKPKKVTLGNIYPQVEFFAWLGPLKRYVVMSRYKLETGYMYGYGCSLTLDGAIQKAYLEIYPNIMWASYKPNLRLVEFGDISKSKKYHMLEGFEPEILKGTSYVIPLVDQNLRKKDFYFCQVDLLLPLNLNKKLYGVRVISPLVQRLFTGEWSDKELNTAVISKNLYKGLYHVVG
jgi:hypothetical protein